MEPGNESPHSSATSTASEVQYSSMARAALGLSIVAFIPPLGIAAVVLGHIAGKRISSSNGMLNGRGMARAALWIGYLQLALIIATALVTWNLFHETALGFQHDALVQRVLRSADQRQTLDPDSARDAEIAAQALVEQLIAMEDQTRKTRADGSYICQLNELLYTGFEDATDAENRAFAIRVRESPYMFRIDGCDSSLDGAPATTYTLTAVPRTPRMPENSAIYCSDQTGAVLQARGGTSADCLKSGTPMR